jgi:hypothetical protein
VVAAYRIADSTNAVSPSKHSQPHDETSEGVDDERGVAESDLSRHRSVGQRVALPRKELLVTFQHLDDAFQLSTRALELADLPCRLDGRPGAAPVSPQLTDHLRSISVLVPNRAATAFIVAHSDPESVT